MKSKSLLIIVMFNLLLIVCQAQGAFFEGLGDLPDGDYYSIARGVSADGSVVVGWSPYQGFRWTPGGGIEGLGYLTYVPMSGAAAVSGDGKVVIGSAAVSMSFEKAYRWTVATGMVSLPFLSGGFDSIAYGVNHDGTAIVGGSTSTETGPYYQAFLWTPVGGTIGLGALKGHDFSTAYGVSADGSVVAGTSWGWTTGQEAFGWTKGGRMVGLGYLPGYDESSGRDISADGKTIVGTCSKAGGQEAFRWRAGSRKFPLIISSMEGLGDLPGGAFESRAYGVSGDGKIVVGVGNSKIGDEAAIWFDGDIRNLKTYLMQLGLLVKGWRLTAAYDISVDGKTIVGFGTNPDGDTEAWIANIGNSPYTGLLPPVLRIVPTR